LAYFKKVLQADERVLIVGRLHWSIYGRSWLILLAAAALGIGACWIGEASARYTVWVAAAVIAVFGVWVLLSAWIRRRTTEIVVTDRRVIYKRGVLSRHTVEMNVSKIEAVDVEQGLGARMLGYGTVLIHGTGSGFEPLRRVSRPLAIRNAIVTG
jgi:uncharacterized membrane protein YdbT with pleckstrin-like domain